MILVGTKISAYTVLKPQTNRNVIADCFIERQNSLLTPIGFELAAPVASNYLSVAQKKLIQEK